MSPLGPAALAGLVGSPHCGLMCGPLLLAQPPAARLGWHAGRLTAYLGLGAIAGLAGGARVLDFPLGPWLALAGLLTFAAELAGLPHPFRRLLGPALAAARPWATGGFALGLLTALLPCGLLWSGLGLAAAAGGPLPAVATMAAFYLGTLPAVAAVGVLPLRAVLDRCWLRRSLAVVLLLVGTFTVGARAGWYDATPDDPQAPCHKIP